MTLRTDRTLGCAIGVLMWAAIVAVGITLLAAIDQWLAGLL